MPDSALPADYVFTPPAADAARILAGLPRLPRDALLRLRLPGLSDAEYAALAERLAPAIRAAGLRLVLDRSPELSQRLRADAHHATSRAWSVLSERPVLPSLRFIGSAHSRADLARLQQLGADAAVLGHVRATATHAGEPGMGWEVWEDAVKASGLPVYAIGGLGPQDIAEAQRRGGAGVAAISAYWS